MAASSSKLLFFLSAILLLIAQAIAQSSNALYSVCFNDKGNYTANSAYATNLNQTLPSLSSNTEIGYGFYNSSNGQNSDKVYAIGLCRGDVQPDLCRSCLNNSTNNLKQLCPTQKEAIEWYGECMLRYSNRSIFGIVETFPAYYKWNQNNVSADDVNQFKQDLRTLLDGLTSQAAAGGSLFKFATGSRASNFRTIFALVQCTPDLTEELCNDCLVGAIELIPKCCDGKQGGRVIRPSCNLRFENFRFYETTAYSAPPPVSPPPPPSTNTTTTKGKGNTSRTVIIIVVPIVAFVVLVISIVIYLRVRKPKKKLERSQIGGSSFEAVDEIGTVESLQFDFDTIKVATDNFSDANKLGQGGFGAVYKGRLSDGQLIAVKRLSMNSGQGDLEFKNEVLLVAKLQHRNLVRLQGFCLEGNERLLIYEFVPNTSLDHFIFDPIKRAHLYWEKRYKIIEGIARGLLYLHEDSRLRIIHRDLKASNVLLDVEMIPKIADFGMARLFVPDQTQGNTSRIVGTYGYMAPEYAMHGQFSVKSDVYSFGVLLMEIVSGQKNNCFRNGDNVEDLLSYAWKNWREGTASNLVDPALRASSATDITRCIHIGLLCVQENVADRPTMGSVVLMLNSYSLTLPIPSQPAFFMHSSIESDISQSRDNLGVSGSSKANSVIHCSINEASITEPLYPR